MPEPVWVPPRYLSPGAYLFVYIPALCRALYRALYRALCRALLRNFSASGRKAGCCSTTSAGYYIFQPGRSCLAFFSPLPFSRDKTHMLPEIFTFRPRDDRKASACNIDGIVLVFQLDVGITPPFLPFFRSTPLRGTVPRNGCAIPAFLSSPVHFGLLGYPAGNAILTIEFHSKRRGV